ncbi:MAG: Rrf2 family transcriptional regulator [Candidatus Sumerlaeia bacterium]|nr:Rrf2 family transcriptional regulator [Candidatus Sumerlaeia bacterium]
MITTTGEYALRAAAYLAQHPAGSTTSAIIAEATKVPHGYLQKVLKQLVRAGLIASQRGLNGGFVLARPAAEISILDVLRAVDAAPQRITRCPLGLAGHVRLCPVHRLVDDATAAIEAAFAKASLADMSATAGGVKALCEAK